MDVSGYATDAYLYDAYGNLIDEGFLTAPAPNDYLYYGEQYDSELGLYFLRARYLNPATGRFWTMDSFEGNQSASLSLHKYLFCHNNPVSRSDPTGHFTDAISFMSAFGIQNSLRAWHDTATLSVGNAMIGTIRGIQEGKLAEEILYDYVAGVFEGAFIGVAVGAGATLASEAWQEGSITLGLPRAASAKAKE